jgi:hypothetical protein
MPSFCSRRAAAALAVLLCTFACGVLGADNPNCRLIVPASPLTQIGFV